MDSVTSLSEFSPLVDVMEDAPAGGGVSGGRGVRAWKGWRE